MVMLGIALALMKAYNPFDDPLFALMLPAVHYCCRAVSAGVAGSFHKLNRRRRDAGGDKFEMSGRQVE